MKHFKLFLSLLLFSFCGLTQEPQEKMMVYNLTLDTLLKADYYLVNITVSEYIQYDRVSKKETRVSLISLDTLTERLMTHLASLGLRHKMEKNSVTEVDNNNNSRGADKKLFQGTYGFRISSKDSVDYLFRNIDKKIVSGMKVTPEVYDATVEKAKQVLTSAGMKMTDEFAKEVAGKMNNKISKSKYHIMFYDAGVGSNFNDFTKKFLINYKDIKYMLTISYTYSFAEN